MPVIHSTPAARDPSTYFVSVVIPARNEHPQILSTILSVAEELEAYGYPYEFVVVSNQSDDGMPEVLEERFAHWIAEERLRVIRFDERPACWHARNIGAEAAHGEVLIICDAHISVAHGTLHSMLQLWSSNGGLWHSASQMWGDKRDTRLYGYALKIEEKFWGNLSRHIPEQIVSLGKPPYTIPMSQYSLFLVGREEFLASQGFHPGFQCYGGGEPYFALKWWMLGKRCWMYPRGLMRHAFGLRLTWKPVDTRMPERYDGHYLKGKGIFRPRQGHVLAPDDKCLSNSRGYSWNNDQLWYNFLLAAYVIGGDKWLEQRRGRYEIQCKGVERYLYKLGELCEKAKADGEGMRVWLEANRVMDLDALLRAEPWNDFSIVV